jgi:hypothetical protein
MKTEEYREFVQSPQTWAQNILNRLPKENHSDPGT